MNKKIHISFYFFNPETLLQKNVSVCSTLILQRDIVRHVMNNVEPDSEVGFWIGLKGSPNQGIWNWVDGRVLIEG